MRNRVKGPKRERTAEEEGEKKKRNLKIMRKEENHGNKAFVTGKRKKGEGKGRRMEKCNKICHVWAQILYDKRDSCVLAPIYMIAKRLNVRCIVKTV